MYVGSLFSGIGGIELGFEREGFETRWFVENDEYCQRVLRKHWPNVPIHGDITTVDFTALERVEVLTGGFPCQDISTANPKGKGIEGERSGLWSYYAEAIRILRPRYAVIENVPNLANRGLNVVLGDLAEIGYDAEWNVVSARGVGARHFRRRIFIVAYPSRAGTGDNARPACGARDRTPMLRQRGQTEAGGANTTSTNVLYPADIGCGWHGERESREDRSSNGESGAGTVVSPGGSTDVADPSGDGSPRADQESRRFNTRSEGGWLPQSERGGVLVDTESGRQQKQQTGDRGGDGYPSIGSRELERTATEVSEDVVDSASRRDNGQRCELRATEKRRQSEYAETRISGTDVVHTNAARLQGHGRPIERTREVFTAEARIQLAELRAANMRGFWRFDPADEPCEWSAQSRVGRVAHGGPARVDRLRCLGNAVVPQVAQFIARRIREVEAEW